MDRPNLFLESVQCPDEDTRWRRLVARIKDSEPPGIVYAPTRRETEELGASAYHGGMSAGERVRVHEDFHADRVPVLVATTAFGMGIDKPNIRWVNHVGRPDSPDSYLQEIGRAGRDGEPAQVLLLHGTEDSGLRKFFSSVSIDAEEITQLAALLRIEPEPLTRDELEAKTGLSRRRLSQLLTLLEEVGAAKSLSRGRFHFHRYGPEPAEAAELVTEQAERRQTVQRSRLDMMRLYAETDQCRGRLLLAYFGEHLDHPCGHCDNCLAGLPPEDDSGPFPIHSVVRHPEWGPGMVLAYAGDQMTVLFDEVGYKTLSVTVVEEHRLLRPRP